MKVFNWIYYLLQGDGENRVGKIVGTTTGGAVGASKTELVDWNMFIHQSLISVVLAATIGYTISFLLGKLYKYLWHKYIRNERSQNDEMAD